MTARAHAAYQHDDGVPDRVRIKQIMLLWPKFDTLEIAGMLWVHESVIYNALDPARILQRHQREAA